MMALISILFCDAVSLVIRTTHVMVEVEEEVPVSAKKKSSSADGRTIIWTIKVHELARQKTLANIDGNVSFSCVATQVHEVYSVIN